MMKLVRADLARFVRLCHRRWAIPVLAELHRLDGAKFITLANRLAVAQTALRQTLRHLIRQRLVRRNPGYGHPLRPEYILAPRAAPLAAACADLHDELRSRDLCDAALRKWSLPILLAAAGEARRFSQFTRSLPGLTDRAASQTLRELAQAGLILRRVVNNRPPTSEYALPADAPARRLLRLAQAVAAAPR